MRRCFDVEQSDDHLVITRFWRRGRRIPLDRVIAVTDYPSVVWYSERGQIARSSVTFFSAVWTKWADRRRSERLALQAVAFNAVAANLRRTKRAFAHLQPGEAAERLQLAHAAVAWTAKRGGRRMHEFHALWAKHLRDIEDVGRRP